MGKQLPKQNANMRSTHSCVSNLFIFRDSDQLDIRALAHNALAPCYPSWHNERITVISVNGFNILPLFISRVAVEFEAIVLAECGERNGQGFVSCLDVLPTDTDRN